MDLLTEKLIGFMLVLTRVGAFFAASPVFSWQSIPNRIKLTMAIFIAIFISSINPCPATSETSALELGLMMANEVVYGLALGLVAILLFSTVKLGARLIEREMGMAMASILDPLSGEQGQPLGMLIEMIFILLFLSANGHHILLMSISKSYEIFHIGTIPTIEKLLEGILSATSTMLLMGLKLSAPIMATFLLMMVVLGFLARIAPEVNILFLSMPLRVGLGLFMVGIFLPFIKNFIKEFARLMEEIMPL